MVPTPGESPIDLLPATQADLHLLRVDVSAFTAARGLTVVEGYLDDADVLLRVFSGMLEHGTPAQWANHLVVHLADSAVIGAAGYKGAPIEGVVEIGYGIAPSYRSRGLATAAARLLVERAGERGVRSVVAETAAEPNHSNALLTKLGFCRVGPARDTDDGPVWRWQVDTRGPATA